MPLQCDVDMVVSLAIISPPSICAACSSLYAAFKLMQVRSSFPDKQMICLLVVFYAMSLINSISGLSHQLLCYLDVVGAIWIDTTLMFIYYWSYILHWIVMLCIYFLRLKMTFDDTTMLLKLPKYHQHIFLVFITSILLLFAINVWGSVTETIPLKVLGAARGGMMLMMTVYSQILVFMFVRRLNILSILSQSDPELVSIMVRQSILVIFSLMSSTLVISTTICRHFFNYEVHDKWQVLATYSAKSVDVLVDNICISLGLSVFKPIYAVLCGVMDRCCKACCARATRSTRKTLEMQLAVCSAPSSEDPSPPNEQVTDQKAAGAVNPATEKAGK